MDEPVRLGRDDAPTLRSALRKHPAGPEVLAALGPLADRPLPDGWTRWAPRRREGYLDTVLDEARDHRVS